MSLTTTILIERTALPAMAPWYGYDMAADDSYNGGLNYGGISESDYTISGIELSGIMLWEAGCFDSSSHTWNCTAFCVGDRGPEMWSAQNENATYTLQNCMVYPLILSALANGSLVQHPANLTDKYAIESVNETHNITSGWTNIDNCIASYCNELGTGSEQNPACNASLATQEGFPPDLGIWFLLCDDVVAPLNPDIGGVGVLISYIMQSLIIIVWYGAQSLTRNWIELPALCLFSVLLRSRAKASKKAKHLQKRLSFPKQMAALTAAMVEFQKTQVFFMLAIQAAALVALSNATYIQASSWDQLWNNLVLFYSIASSGIDPIVFNLLMLWKAKKASAYLLVASTCCVAVSLLTLGMVKNLRVSPSQVVSEGPGLPECGGLVSPTQYCMNQWIVEAHFYVVRTAPSYSVSVVIFGCLLADKPAVFGGTAKGEAKLNVFRYLKRQGNNRLSKSMLWLVPALCTIAVLFAECWLLYTNVSAVMAYLFQLHYFAPRGKGAWSLGQIIAVGVWVPVMAEWAYLTFGGLEEGSQYRLVAPYRVVKQNAQQSPDPNAASILHVNTLVTDADDDAVSSAHELSPLDPRTSYGVVHAKTWSPLA